MNVPRLMELRFSATCFAPGSRQSIHDSRIARGYGKSTPSDSARHSGRPGFLARLLMPIRQRSGSGCDLAKARNPFIRSLPDCCALPSSILSGALFFETQSGGHLELFAIIARHALEQSSSNSLFVLLPRFRERPTRTVGPVFREGKALAAHDRSQFLCSGSGPAWRIAAFVLGASAAERSRPNSAGRSPRHILLRSFSDVDQRGVPGLGRAVLRGASP